MDILGAPFKKIIEKAPLPVMIRGMFESSFNAEIIDELFENSALRQYTRELRFSTVVNLMLSVVFDIHPSVGAAYAAADGTIGVSEVSVYNKLNGVEPHVAAALVSYSAERCGSAIEQTGGALAALLPGYRVKIIDGNHFSASERRLKEQRSRKAAPLPGKALVVLDPQLKLATNLIPIEDGHAQERSVFSQILPLVERGDLWIADRNFCTQGLLNGIIDRQGSFLVRQHGALELQELRTVCSGVKVQSGILSEQHVELLSESSQRRQLRRITIALTKPTRDGSTHLHLLTNIEGVSAIELASLYRKRWKIENVFQELTTTLTCEVKTLGYPRAAILAFSLAVVAYNAISCVKAALRAEYGIEAIEEKMSGYYVNLEFRNAYCGMMFIIEEDDWAVFRRMTTEELAGVLSHLSKRVSLTKYPKRKRGPKKPHPPRIDTGSPHVSTARLLATRKKK